jgi:uncharacterized membrane protein YeaQ/YmgE (transglycosylase-associated protein family)
MDDTLSIIGALCFGIVVGWITYRSLRRQQGSALSDISAVIGAVGGAAVLTLFKTTSMFSGYCIGLAVGFFAYLSVNWFKGAPPWAIQ